MACTAMMSSSSSLTGTTNAAKLAFLLPSPTAYLVASLIVVAAGQANSGQGLAVGILNLIVVIPQAIVL
ncbi:unnamed protein product [Sphagnum jensenii]|uniref:Uncharacterized protein n=1 Tax=Sphagnum jensenii TaxID=128206 RepID=A0ABP1ARZ3_9BRYO